MKSGQGDRSVSEDPFPQVSTEISVIFRTFTDCKPEILSVDTADQGIPGASVSSRTVKPSGLAHRCGADRATPSKRVTLPGKRLRRWRWREKATALRD